MLCCRQAMPCQPYRTTHSGGREARIHTHDRSADERIGSVEKQDENLSGQKSRRSLPGVIRIRMILTGELNTLSLYPHNNDRKDMDKLMIDKLSDFFRTQPVDKAWIFGSYSRNEEEEGSDIDVLVRFLKGIRITLFSYASMQYKIERLLNKKIDLVEEGQLKDFAEDSANADKILIYERKK